MLACQAVVFEAGRNLASKSAFVSLRRDSLRLSCLKAKAGGKGIRTPGLLIANETLYQLSYTPIYLAKTAENLALKIPLVHRFYPL